MSADNPSAATARRHSYLPEMCGLLPACDKAHAGPESLDSFPLFLPAKCPAESA